MSKEAGVLLVEAGKVAGSSSATLRHAMRLQEEEVGIVISFPINDSPLHPRRRIIALHYAKNLFERGFEIRLSDLVHLALIEHGLEFALNDIRITIVVGAQVSDRNIEEIKQEMTDKFVSSLIKYEFVDSRTKTLNMKKVQFYVSKINPFELDKDGNVVALTSQLITEPANKKAEAKDGEAATCSFLRLFSSLM